MKDTQTETQIDLTPSWKSIVLLLARLYYDGDKFAEQELLKMARIADSYVDLFKNQKGTELQ
jgi:hypothetical protein